MTGHFTHDHDQEIAGLYQSGQTTYAIAARFGVSPTPITRALARQGIELRKGGKRTPWSDTAEQRAAVVAAYESGESIRRLAKRIGVNAGRIIKVLNDAEIARRPVGGFRALNEDQARQVAAGYGAGKKLTDLAAQYGVSYITIRNYLVKAGVELRKPGVPEFWTEERVAEAVRRRLSGQPQQKIAREMGCSQPGVSYALAKSGVAVPGMPRLSGDRHGSWKGGRTMRDGYVFVKVPDGDSLASMRNGSNYVAEHRLVMARKLGRPLLPGERPHHKNTIRTDNTPPNLELWLTSQPSGGRVSDLIEHALGLLETYLPAALVPGWQDLPRPEQLS